MTINTVSTTGYLPNVPMPVPSLPEDLWPGILGDLPRVKLDLFSRVSKQCRALMKSPQFLANLLERKDIYFSDRTRRQLYLKAGPYLSGISLYDHDLQDSYLKELTAKCSSVVSLKFSQIEAPYFDFTPLNSFRQLTQLCVYFHASNPCQLKLNPNLRSLFIGFFFTSKPLTDLNPLISQINSLTQLEEFYLVVHTNLEKQNFTAPTSLRKLLISASRFDLDLGKFLQGNTNLVSLEINCKLTENSVNYLTKCTHLTTLACLHLPASFSIFKNLKNLKLALQIIQPQEYPCLASFEKLERLQINFGDAYFPIERLASLTDLQIDRRDFELPLESLCQLRNLIRLDFQVTKYSGDFGLLSALQNLTSIGVPDRLAEHDLISIGALTAVKNLTLSNLSFSTEAFKSLTSITSLYIFSRDIKLNYLKYLTNLDCLYLNCPRDPPPNFSDLNECTSLRKLRLNFFGPAGDQDITELTRLTQLNSIGIPQLDDVAITDPRFEKSLRALWDLWP